MIAQPTKLKLEAFQRSLNKQPYFPKLVLLKFKTVVQLLTTYPNTHTND